jgi:ABC-type branched-subunit amino acid transport system substrate-binding protein
VLTERGKTVLLWCSSCQDRIGIAALLHGVAATATMTTPSRHDEVQARQQARQRALNLWDSSRQAPGSPAAAYLACRGLPALANPNYG